METRQKEGYVLLKKYGSRWAILAALKMDLEKKGIDLLAKSMKGELDYNRLIEIPALKTVESSCGFLKCSC